MYCPCVHFDISLSERTNTDTCVCLHTRVLSYLRLGVCKYEKTISSLLMDVKSSNAKNFLILI